MSLAEQKRLARAEATIRRDAVHQAAGMDLGTHGLPFTLTETCRIVSGFHPFGNEIKVLDLLARLLSEGWVTALPVVVAKEQPLVFRQWKPGEALVKGRWDIPVPLETSPEVDPDVLLVPMLAFDRTGYRLGYGGGFYDRTLEKLRRIKDVTAIGVAYAGQEIEHVPRDAHDQPLDWIMTEQGTFKCG